MIERKIIIGLITSSEFLLKVKPIWNQQFLESDSARKVSVWIWEYFDKYNKAPGKDIETIFFAKLREGKIQKDIAEEIESEILPSLSKEFVEEGINIQPLYDETEKYFNERSLQLLSDNVAALVDQGKSVEAEHLIETFKPLSGSLINLNQFIKSVAQIRRSKPEVPKMLMSPWLRAGQLTIIYGNFGTGKTLLCLSVAYLLGLDEFDREECEIDKWHVKNPTGCLYIDGEMGESEMEERVAQFEWLGPQDRDNRLKILSVPEYQLATEDSFYLAERKNQLKIISWLKEHTLYKLIILDSVSTLFGLEEENSNSEWIMKISPFIRDLKAMGVACILLGHSGKDGKRGMRGASAMGAMPHNIFRLVNHERKNMDAGEAWFQIIKEKQRTSGASFRSFSMKYTQSENKKETHWEITQNV